MMQLLRRRALSTSTLIYPAPPPPGAYSGRTMDPTVWPKIAPIWPSSAFFPHEIDTLHEEDDERRVPIGNARQIDATLDKHGFQLLASPCGVQDFTDEMEVEQYKQATANMVCEMTGASLCVAFNHVLLDTAIEKFGKRSGAVERVHGDYTQSSGPLMLSELCDRGVLPPSAANRRGAIINVWRNASATPVRSKPLAVCDVRSVPQEALGTYFLVEGGDKSPRRMGQNLKLHYSPGHAWWYYPQMTKDEALVFYTYDGREPESPRFTLHSAFDEEGTPADAPARSAFIVRLAAIW